MAESQNIPKFLMETWQGLVGLEEAVEGLGGADADLAKEALVGLTHRLETSAAEHGFPRVSHLATGLGRLVRRMGAEDSTSFEDAHQLLREALTVLPMVLETVATGGTEEIPQVAGLQWRLDAEVAAAEERAAERARADVAGEIDRGLLQFREQDQEMLSFFAPEAREHLEGMELQLARLRSTTSDPDVLNTLFRHVHTLKGAAFTVGCEPIGQLAHCVEDLLVPLRDSHGRPSREGFAASSAAAALMREMVARLEGQPGPTFQSRYDDLLGTFRGLLSRESDPPSLVAIRGTGVGELASVGYEDDGETVELEPFDDPAFAASVGEEVVLGEEAVADDITAAIDSLEEDSGAAGAFGPGSGTRAATEGEPELERTDSLRLDVAADGDLRVQGSLRPDSNRLDDLTRGLARLDRGHRRLELILEKLQRWVDRPGGGLDGEDAEEQLRSLSTAAAGEAKRLAGLHDLLRSDLQKARKVPLSQLFGRFSRLVRSVASDADLSVVLETEGGEIEIDHRMLERLAEPLTHLVTNAIHHGLESGIERRARGKASHGTVRLAARLRGRRLHLEVSDDGRGIDADALRRKARAAGLISEGDPRLDDDRAAYSLIFLPGLTTAERVTTAAGRGVGMDAVLHAVRRANGRIDIESERSVGTRFTIEVPTSVDSIEVVRARVGASVMAVPTSAIAALHPIADGGASYQPGRVPLSELLGISAAAPRRATVAGTAIELKQGPLDLGVHSSTNSSADGNGTRSSAPATLWVDEISGIEEGVLEPLGRLLGELDLYRGVLVDRDGRIIPVLDPWRAARLLPPSTSTLTAMASSTFTAVDSGEHRPAPGAPGDPVEPGEEGRLPVLLVDDSPTVRRVLRRILERAGHTVVTAEDGAAALEWLGNHRASALVTDLEMPRLSGQQLIDRLGRDPAAMSLPIAVITTRVSDHQRARAQQQGVGIFLPKPVDNEELLNWLADHALVAGPEKDGATTGGSGDGEVIGRPSE